MHKRAARMRQWFRYDGEGLSFALCCTVCPQSHSACFMAAVCLRYSRGTLARGLCYQLIEWLTRKHPNAKTAFLPFYGKNQVY
jgi:hypothetical protein